MPGRASARAERNRNHIIYHERIDARTKRKRKSRTREPGAAYDFLYEGRVSFAKECLHVLDLFLPLTTLRASFNDMPFCARTMLRGNYSPIINLLPHPPSPACRAKWMSRTKTGKDPCNKKEDESYKDDR